jgi:hypothetical protein
MDELFKVYAMPVKSDFEIGMRKEVEAWIRKQPAHKTWATPGRAYEEYWAEKLK